MRGLFILRWCRMRVGHVCRVRFLRALALHCLVLVLASPALAFVLLCLALICRDLLCLTCACPSLLGFALL